jgi:hypothetical protein
MYIIFSHVFERQVGRFSFESGTNFNRNWLDCFVEVAAKVENQLTLNEKENVILIRRAILEEIDASPSSMEEQHLKLCLLRYAAVADIVLDLHCDTNAILHMYTHEKLWPALSDLAFHLKSQCQIVSSEDSGGRCFDETCSNIWDKLSRRFPAFPIPMACQSATVELRGQNDVSF